MSYDFADQQMKIQKDTGKIYKVALKIYHPFIGLLNWKKRGVVSAIQHSLNTAMIAGGVASLLTKDEDVVDLAVYNGLLHDIYQKAKSTCESLTREKLNGIISHVLEDADLEGNLIRKILDCCNYNVAENPSILLGDYAISGVSLRLADLIASAENIHEAVRSIHNEVADEKIGEICGSLKATTISIFIPQVALRSLIYRKAVEQIQRQVEDQYLPVICRGGLLIITTKNSGFEQPIEVDYSDLKAEIGITFQELLENITDHGRIRNVDKDKERIEKFAVEADKTITISNALNSFLLGVKITGVNYGGEEGKCMICGLPVADPIPPTYYGRIKYKEASTERWSPRYPACGDMNKLLSRKDERWKRNKMFICDLCALNALVERKIIYGDKQEKVDYFIQFFFMKPTHYDVASYLSSLAHNIVLGEVEGDVDLIESLLYKPWEILEKMSVEREPILIDFTWAMHLSLLEGTEKEKEMFAMVLPNISKAILPTGIYPAKFTHIPDPAVERRIIMPTHPLYSYDVNDEKHGRLVPLTLFTIALLDKLKDKNESELKYLNHPFWMVEDLLMKYKVGREVLSAYDAFTRDPYAFLFKE